MSNLIASTEVHAQGKIYKVATFRRMGATYGGEYTYNETIVFEVVNSSKSVPLHQSEALLWDVENHLRFVEKIFLHDIDSLVNGNDRD